MIHDINRKIKYKNNKRNVINAKINIHHWCSCVHNNTSNICVYVVYDDREKNAFFPLISSSGLIMLFKQSMYGQKSNNSKYKRNFYGSTTDPTSISHSFHASKKINMAKIKSAKRYDDCKGTQKHTKRKTTSIGKYVHKTTKLKN